MTKRRRLWTTVAVLTAIAVAAPVLAGCGGSASAHGDKRVTITFANHFAAEETTRPAILALIKQFEAGHPDVKVDSEAISFTNIGQQLVLQVNARNPPDVAELTSNDTYAVAGTNGIARASSSPTLAALRPQLTSGEVSADLIDGGYQVVPWADSPAGFWYNRTLLAKAGIAGPPRTIDALDRDLAIVKAKLPTAIPLAMDTSVRAFGLAAQWPIMRAFGAQPFTADGTATSDTPQMKRYLQWIQMVAKRHYTLPDRMIGDFRPLAAQGDVVFAIDQPFMQDVVQLTNGQSAASFYKTWGVAAIPAGPVGRSFSTPYRESLVMFKKAVDDGKEQAAAEFIRWLVTSPQAQKFAITTLAEIPTTKRQTPAVRKLLDTPVLRAFHREVVPTNVEPAYGAVFSAAVSPVMAGVETAMSGGSVDTIASQMQTSVKQQTR